MGLEPLLWFETPGVVAAVWPKEAGVSVSKTERPVLQPASSPVLRGLLPGLDTPELRGPQRGSQILGYLLGALSGWRGGIRSTAHGWAQTLEGPQALLWAALGRSASSEDGQRASALKLWDLVQAASPL